MLKALKHSLLFSLVLTLPLFAWGEFKVPQLKAPVNDYARMLAPSQERSLNSALKNMRQQGGPQLVILTVPRLHGLSIEQASIKVTDQWQLGNEDKDDGLLLIIALNERKIRIEVGQGLEGDVPDAYAKRIIDETMVPLIRDGQVGTAVFLASFNLARLTMGAEKAESLFKNKNQNFGERSRKPKSSPLTVITIFVLFFLLAIFGRGTAAGFLLGAMLGGGPRGGGGFGGGGFGGGGGGFSGGGASGGW